MFSPLPHHQHDSSPEREHCEQPVAHPRSSRGGRVPAEWPHGSGWWPPAPGPCSSGQLPSAAGPARCCCSAGWLWLPSIRHGSSVCCRNCDTYRERRGIVNVCCLRCLCTVMRVLNVLHLKLRKKLLQKFKKKPTINIKLLLFNILLALYMCVTLKDLTHRKQTK